MKLACVLIPHLRALVEQRRRPHLRKRPIIIVDRSRGRSLVADFLPEDRGIDKGTSLEQALSLCNNAAVLEADEPRYRQVFDEVLIALQGVSDRVEAAELGVAYVGIGGLEGMYGGDARIARALVNAVPLDLRPRVGLGRGKFPAYMAATKSKPHGAFRIPVDVSAFLAPHSIDLLPVSPRLKDEMHRLGLHRMGEVASLGVHTLSQRFGPEGKKAWELCNGIDRSPLVPMTLDESVVEHTSLPFHTSSMDTLLVALDALLRRAYARPDMKGRCASAVDLLCTATGWPTWKKRMRFKQPAATWKQASFSLKSRLETDPPTSPVEDMTLTLSDFTPDSGTQMELLKDARDDRRQRLIEVDRKLMPLMRGHHALHTIARVAPWHPAPEMRALQVPVDPSGRDAIKPLQTPEPVEVRTEHNGEPAAVRVGRRWQHVARIDDRWTFDLWWLPQPVTRSYYRVDPGDGRRMTLFRDGRNDHWYRQGAG